MGRSISMFAALMQQVCNSDAEAPCLKVCTAVLACRDVSGGEKCFSPTLLPLPTGNLHLNRSLLNLHA